MAMKQLDGHLYEEIVQSMQEGVMVIDMNGEIVMLNPAAQHILGVMPEDVGKTYGAVFLLREENDAFNEIILNTVCEKTRADRVPVEFVRDGATASLLLTTSYIYNNGERAVVVVINDVTKLNELRDTQIALKVAEGASEAKSRFLSNMSHEIRTPINAVLGMNEMILRESQDSEILSYASNIQSSGKTLLALVNDILDLSKIESGKMEIIPVEYKVSAVILDLWNVIYFRAKEKGLGLSLDLDESLPGVLYGDDIRIKQIVTNLLTNAVKYTPKGSVELKIAYERQNKEFACKESSDKELSDREDILLRISVIDTGMGIRKEDMNGLFESFQRLDEEKNRNIEGTGLGMSITLSLLKMMGGSLQVESEYQKGSVFTAVIPQQVADDAPIGSFEHIQKSSLLQKGSRQGSFTAPRARVLVVDDNEMNLTVFKALLKRTKLQVVTADSGKQCLDMIQKQEFHIIFMDHMMPELDGIETLHAMNHIAGHKNRNTPVIALTANAVAGAREQYLSEGFWDFLTKPIDSGLLERIICEYLPQELIVPNDEEMKTENETVNGHDAYLQQGVSVESGLRYSQGDMQMYLELVRLFIKDKNKMKQLRGCLSEHRMKDYAIQVHGLKGNARMLGADLLADIAYEHELQSKASCEEYITGHWKELEQAWEQALDVFGKLYDQYAGSREENQKLPVGEALDLSREQLREMAERIDAFQTEEAVLQMKEWLRHSLDAQIRRMLEEAVSAIEDEYDEDKAVALLKEEL